MFLHWPLGLHPILVLAPSQQLLLNLHHSFPVLSGVTSLTLPAASLLFLLRPMT